MIRVTSTAWLGLSAALIALVLTLGVEDAQAQVPTTGTFASTPVYSASRQASAVFRGGTIDQLEAAARGANAGGVWAQSSNGAFQLLIVDGPAFLRAPFTAQFPTGFSTSTAVTLVVAKAAVPPGGEPRAIALRSLGGKTWSQPTEMGAYPQSAGDGTTFVLEQAGTVWAVLNGTATTILDLRDRVALSSEEGLLSMALDPGFATNRHVWVYYSAASPRRSVLARFTRNANELTINRDSALVVLEVPQPFSNHNGGAIRFGPDGMLYLGLGDGGSGGDPNGNGQNLGTLLGKIIRIDVRAASAAQPYLVPGDNPFIGTAGARGEIYAYGFRNPWRMAFDPASGALWAGDVGQGAAEEIDLVQRGGNYGWNITEGDRCYRPSSGCSRTGLTAPVAAYDHSNGRCSVTGGFVYRGTLVPEIAGAYVYADYCSGEVWAIRADAPGTPVTIATGAKQITSFGIDANGELYVLSQGQPIRQIVRP